VIIDVGWTICGRNQTFSGELQGNGTFRTIDWLIVTDRFPALRPWETLEFGVNRVSFIVDSKQYPNEGVVTPN
jgi:hypothetical protein